MINIYTYYYISTKGKTNLPNNHSILIDPLLPLLTKQRSNLARTIHKQPLGNSMQPQLHLGIKWAVPLHYLGGRLPSLVSPHLRLGHSGCCQSIREGAGRAAVGASAVPGKTRSHSQSPDYTQQAIQPHRTVWLRGGAPFLQHYLRIRRIQIRWYYHRFLSQPQILDSLYFKI